MSADDHAGGETPVYHVETAKVYRAGGRRFFSRDAAIRRYARSRFFAKHPCECEQGDYASGYPGYDCGCHERLGKALPRYLRLIRRSLRRTAPTGPRPSAGDLLCATVDRWAQHSPLCEVDPCPECDACFNQVRLAWKVWSSSQHKAVSHAD